MKTKLLTKLMVLTLLSALLIVPCVRVKTNPVGYTVTDYDNAMTKAADRLNETQNNDGTWEWLNPDLDPTNGPGAPNTVGVTALGLLDAYELTGNSTYLDKAENRSAIFIKDNLYQKYALGNPTYPDLTSFDLNFLIELSEVLGNDTYTNWASEDWEWRKTNATTNQYFGYGNQSAIVSTLVVWGGDGLAAWECGKLILAATGLEDTTWAEEMADEINKTNGLLANLTITDVQWPLAGLTLKALQELNSTTYASAISYLKNLLEANQNADGSWGSPPFLDKVQNTAYAIIGEVSVGNLIAARKGADWLVANQNATTGGWSGSDEITEIDSEAAQGLKATADAVCISQGDLNCDRTVNIADVVMAALAFGSEPGDPNWNPIVDLNGDDLINIRDLVRIGVNFGKTPT